MTYFVAGATGNTGRSVADALLARGEQVRVFIRKPHPMWNRDSVEVVIGSLESEAELTRALSGVKGAYILLPPAPDAADVLTSRTALAKILADAIKSAQVPTVALLSSFGAHLPSGTGPIVTTHRAEEILRESAPSFTSVRAGYFMENWAPLVDTARQQGVVPSFLPLGHAIPMVASADIGHSIADALISAVEGRHTIELAGPRDFSDLDVAEALSRLLGRDVQVATAPVTAVAETFSSMGMGQDLANLYQELFSAIHHGTLTFEHPDQVRRGSTDLVQALARFV